MKDRGCRVQRDRSVGLDPRVLPAPVLSPPDGRHVIGEYAAKPGSYQQLRPLGRRGGGVARGDLEVKLLAQADGHCWLPPVSVLPAVRALARPARCGTVSCGTVSCGTVRCGTARRGTAGCGPVS